MTEVRAAFPEFESMDVPALEQEKNRILREANGNWRDLPDEDLTKLWRITRALRRKVSHTGKKKTASGERKKKTTTLSDLA